MPASIVEQEFAFRSGDLRLAGTIARTPGEGSAPAVVLLSGSGAHDRDETVCGHRPFRVLSDGLARSGFAVLRFDGRGVGGSSGDAERADFQDAVDDAGAAFRALRSEAGIDGARVSLLGHSEGGLVAAAASAGLPVRSIVLLAAPAVPIESLLHLQARNLSIEAGATEGQVAHERRMNRAAFEVALGPAPEAEALREASAVYGRFLETWPGVAPFDAGTISQSAETMAAIVCAPAYRSLLRQDPERILAAVEAPVLAVYGGRDTQVQGPENREAFLRAVRGNPRADVLLFDEANHLFQAAGTGSISEYEGLPPGPTQEVLRAIARWIGKA